MNSVEGSIAKRRQISPRILTIVLGNFVRLLKTLVVANKRSERVYLVKSPPVTDIHARRPSNSRTNTHIRTQSSPTALYPCLPRASASASSTALQPISTSSPLSRHPYVPPRLALRFAHYVTRTVVLSSSARGFIQVSIRILHTQRRIMR